MLSETRSIPLSVVLLCAGALILAGCSDSRARGGGGDTVNNNGPACVDPDGDGFGAGCQAGPDCVEGNPDVHVCDCSVDDYAGCACEGTDTERCFEGPAAADGVGVCTAGTRTCLDGHWSGCQGQILGTPELCNERDDDCDGVVDNGVEYNACGTCEASCEVVGVGPGEAGHFDLSPDKIENLVANDEGGLVLTEGGIGEYYFLWVANSAEGTVSKVDTRTGREVARYISAIKVSDLMPDSDLGCNPGNCPSRTAVDLEGNVWVANRAFDFQSSVTKIANEHCVDRNGDGLIETSTDVNGDGMIDRSNPAEYFGEADECILFTVPVGGADGLARALAIDPFAPVRGVGSVWVGNWNEKKYYQLDASDGSVLREVDVPHRPYGAVMDRFGVLWSGTKMDAEQALVPITSADGQVGETIPLESSNDCANQYGISIDGSDNVWLAGRECSSAFRYTPSTQTWFTVDFRDVDGYVRGVAADRDGWIYVGLSRISDEAAGVIVKFRAEDGSQRQLFDAAAVGGEHTIGVGLDYQGKVWGVNLNTDNVTRLDPDTGVMETFPVGHGPYTYSDFTGYALRTFTAPRGTYDEVFEGCPERETAVWKGVEWDADTPPGTSVEVWVRSADTLEGLAQATSYGPLTESPADLEGVVPDGKYLSVEVTLTSDQPGSTPVLWGLRAMWACPQVL